MKTGIFIGRFQPFHNGHLEIVKRMFVDMDKVIICIGSAEKYGTEENPFNADDRLNMINLTLKKVLNTNQQYLFIKVPDIKDDKKWAHNICSFANEPYYIYTGNKRVAALFKNKKVIKLPRLNNISGTKIREYIKKSKKWEHLVPIQVAKYIK